MAILTIKVTLKVGQSQISLIYILIYTVEEINAANQVTFIKS